MENIRTKLFIGPSGKTYEIREQNGEDEEILSNEADANVENYEYDYYITNNGTIEEFDQNIMNFYYMVLLKLIRGI